MQLRSSTRTGEEPNVIFSNGSASTNGTTHRVLSENNGKISNGNGSLTNGNGSIANGKSTPGHHDIHIPEKGFFGNFFHYTFVPIALMSFVPNLALLYWYSVVKSNGSYLLMLEQMSKGGGFLVNLTNLWLDLFNGVTADVWYIMLGYCLFAVLLMVIVPGDRTEGPLTPKGNTPVYKDNGFRCYVVTLVVFGLMTYFLKQNGMSPTIVYDKFESFLMVTNISGHILCALLLVKGLTKPTTTDSGSSGNIVFDYYWGLDLYPRILGIDIKVFTNCRFGMTVWPLLVLIFAIKSYEEYGFVDSMWVSCVLQMMYITKFFWWEGGYYSTIDISVDRAGYMLCWGCMSYIPGIYASVSLYLVTNPVQLGPVWSAVILLSGALSIAVNYWADYQRQIVRSTGGRCTIWGKKPKLIQAKYWVQKSDGFVGEPKNSLLLVSGFWSIARHFNYVPEILLAFFWSLPGLFHNFMVYSYVIYLTILLIHRSFRDDEKCLKKYGKYWQEYCRQVPYKMVPGIL